MRKTWLSWILVLTMIVPVMLIGCGAKETGSKNADVQQESAAGADGKTSESENDVSSEDVSGTGNTSNETDDDAEAGLGDGDSAAKSDANMENSAKEQEEEPVLKDMQSIMAEYNAGIDLEDNPFWDSLVYTGYNIEKHYADGLMWHYVLAAQKRGKGWLSDITYAGGSLGYETTEEGLPDIEFFEKHGLVCASYVSYVYFNYLPNVAGIDTSVLTMPEQSYSANDWYTAAKDWVEQGYSKKIDFEASLTGAGFIDFETLEEMPVGSIIAFCDSRNKSDYCSHVVIYAGYENDYHWVYHVGNENGPEFCSVQRMHFGPDPQWPIAVITTPDFVMEAIAAEFEGAE